ncbi:MAG TPA: hypothetical protein VGS11_10455 [Candidatus Bathyarchaeia archaeon]|nr:hypothetical protein [Candidatus Bathyarchaeia archaeon]
MLTNRTIGIVSASVAVGIIILAAIGTGVLSTQLQTGTRVVHGSFLPYGNFISTNNTSNYLPNGYHEVQVNLSTLKNETEITLGSVSFTYYVPSTNPRAGVEVSYACDSFFAVRLPNGSQLLLEHCSTFGGAQRSVTMTTTVKTGNHTGIEFYKVATSWNEFELTRNTTPIVGLHMKGTGDNVTFVGLIVGN